MNFDNVVKLTTAAVIAYLIFIFALLGFGIWIILKLLAFWGVI